MTGLTVDKVSVSMTVMYLSSVGFKCKLSGDRHLLESGTVLYIVPITFHPVV